MRAITLHIKRDEWLKKNQEIVEHQVKQLIKIGVSAKNARKRVKRIIWRGIAIETPC